MPVVWVLSTKEIHAKALLRPKGRGIENVKRGFFSLINKNKKFDGNFTEREKSEKKGNIEERNTFFHAPPKLNFFPGGSWELGNWEFGIWIREDGKEGRERGDYIFLYTPQEGGGGWILV